MTDQFATYPSLRGQVAFVSGGATGLGAEFVAQLAAQGVRVGFVDVQDDAGQALAAAVAELGHPPPLYQHCDVRDVPALQAAIAEAADAARPGHGAGQQRRERPAAPGRDAERRRSGTTGSTSTCATTSSPPRRSRR